MEFLPIKKDGSAVYAGFWKRFGASLVDSFVLFPFGMILIFHASNFVSSAIVVTVVSSSFFAAYTVLLHYRYGATVGKMVTDIKVTLPNGSPIGIKEAFLRSCVELGLSIMTMFAEVSAISNADSEQYRSLIPTWHETVETICWIWFWSEVVVLLFNERKRAIHDFIAGTVVIHKRFAK